MERRGYPRFPVEFPLSYSGLNRAGEGTVVDLSKIGLKLTVVSEQPVPTGEYLKLRLSLPDNQPALEVELAAVRWSREQMFGVELLYLEPEGSHRLERFLRTLETRQSR